MSMCLGRLPHDAAALATEPTHRRGAAGPIPDDWPGARLRWVPTLAQNNRAPTCCVAGLANSLRLWALAKGFDLEVEDQALFDLYAAVAGCQPTIEAIAATDGLQMLEVLRHIRQRGFRYSSQAQAPAELVFTVLDPTDMHAMRDSIYVHGSAYVGVDLYDSDLTMPPAWRGAAVGDPRGGHCIVPFRYSAAGFGDATWGVVADDDAAWMTARAREAYALGWLLAVA